MRFLLVALLLMTGFACRKPSPLPPPQARLMVRFLDRDAVLDLAAPSAEGPWRLMNAGLWEAMEVRWKPGSPRIGAAVVGRTAPDWVLLEDPAQDTHRVVMRGPEDDSVPAKVRTRVLGRHSGSREMQSNTRRPGDIRACAHLLV